MPKTFSKNRIRILFYSHTGLISGAERVLLGTINGLDRSIFDPIAACPVDGDLTARFHASQVLIVPVSQLEARFTLNTRQLVRYFRSFAHVIWSFRASVKQVAPDVLHANSIRAGIVASIAMFGTGLPVIWHVHDDLPKHPVSSLIRLAAFLSPHSLFLAVSKATATAFVGRFPFGDRIEVLYNGVDQDLYPVKTTTKSSFRMELGLTEEDFLLCAVGMINPRKGLTGLLDAFKVVYDKMSTVHLAIIGAPIFNRDDQYFVEIKDKARQLNIEDRVHFTGARTDVPALLRSADMLVLNTLSEPFGLVLIEAMSSGTPVITTRVGGIPEIVTDNETGFLVEPNDAPALAARLLEVITDSSGRCRVASAALLKVCPRFSQERYCAGYMSYFRSKFSQTGAFIDVAISAGAGSNVQS